VRPNKSAQNFDNSALVAIPVDVDGQLLQGVNSTQAAVDLAVAQLSYGLCVAIGQMASLGQPECML
jgi:hypothetical protein